MRSDRHATHFITCRSPVLTGDRWVAILKKNREMSECFWKRETSH